MRKVLLVVSFVVAVQYLAKAQQDPQFSQFFTNKMHYNPGYAGVDEKICVLGAFRTQWMSFGSSTKGYSPVTQTYSINGPVGKHLGLGLNIYKDQLGFETSIIPTFSLSYRVHLSNGGVIAPGVGIGFIQKGLDGTKYKFNDANDSKIPDISVSGTAMDISAGIYYTQPTLSMLDNFYAGFSMSHMNQATITYSWKSFTLDYPAKMHYFFMTGAEYRISNTLAIDPNIFLKTDIAKWSTDINVMAVYNEKFRGGITYRTSNELSFLLGYRFSPDLQFGYSFDLTLNTLRSYNDGTHELLLKYCFMPKMKPKPEKIPIPRLTPRFL